MDRTECFNALANLYEAMVTLNLKDGACSIIKKPAPELITSDTPITNVEELVALFRKYLILPVDRERIGVFLNVSTLVERLGDVTSLDDEFKVRGRGWFRVIIVPGAKADDGTLEEVLVCFRDVNEKKTAAIKSQKDLEKHNMVLKDALAAAHHASQAKTTFLNSMSHDIRTPMNAIIGFTSLAAANIDNKEAIQDYLKKIAISSNHLLSLINDVLDMSRIESGRTKLEEIEVCLPDVLHDLRAIIHSSIQAKQLDFFVDTQDVIHENIMVDKLRLNQVLLNILGNAIKFTPVGGTISLRVIEVPCRNADYAEYEFRIKDTGIGMSHEYQKHIFEPFSREETTTVSGIQGSGLGMAITKNIVDMMNGAIAVNSEVGKGTEFTVVLDVKKVGKPVNQEVIPELNNMHALVADDDFNTCSSVSKMLTTIGMRPEWTTSGKEAVLRTRYAKESGDDFHAFIIDWLMPDMNGIEVVRRIRSEIGNDTPIIILTAYDWTGIEEEAREAGVTGFCAKPLFLSELREVLERPFRKPVVQQDEEAEVDIDVFAGKRILLVEDNELNQELAVAILTNFGFEVELAGNGVVALELMNEHDAGYYDVVLTDIQMPLMDGYETCREIRALNDPQKANVPILALTANAFEEDMKSALEAGMNGHLTKPIDVQELVKTLAKFM